MKIVEFIAEQYGTTATEVEAEISHQPWAVHKRCFENAYHYASNTPGAVYVLGQYVIHGMPVEHAWVKDGDKHLEITLKGRTPNDRFFVLFELDEIALASAVIRCGQAPNLYDYAKIQRRDSYSMGFG